VRENTLAYFLGMKHIFLAGVMADKDYPALFDILNEAADEFVCVTPSNPRALRAEELAAFLRKYQKPVSVCDTVQDGVEKAKELALESNGAVIATGSLYMSGDIRACFGLY
jgi:dihydrofolate synthase/folylpolyglutamate synthase